MTNNQTPKTWWQKWLEELYHDGRKNTNKPAQEYRTRLESNEEKLQRILNQKETLRQYNPYNTEEERKNKMAELERDEISLREKIKGATTLDDKLSSAALNIGERITNAYLNIAEKNANEERDRTNLILTTAITADIKEKGALERMKEWFNPKNLRNLSGFTTVTVAGLLGTYYGSKLTYNYIDSLIGKPMLVRESTRHNWKHGFKSFFTETLLGKKQEEIKLEDVILPQDMAEKLKFLADNTRSTQENALPYRHVLFYGMPGTGKTMFAKRLAKYSGMDYAIMSGADFAQFKNGEDITELHKLFDWAEHSDKGLLIFIDEADAFLRDRRVLNNQSKDLLNAFLSRTGASSDKFMLVFATNYEDELDPAALSRINKKIHFPLPAIEERIKIINLYLNKYIKDEERIIKRGNTKVKIKIEIQVDINENFIENIAKKIDGFSGREIEQMISELRMSVYNKTGGVLTRDIFNDVVSDKIKEHEHDMACAKQQRARYEASLGQIQISMK